MKKIQNPQAFPSVVPQGLVNGVNDGMTLRDYFAAAAIQGLLSNPMLIDGTQRPTTRPITFELVDDAFHYADVMLEQRTKK